MCVKQNLLSFRQSCKNNVSILFAISSSLFQETIDSPMDVCWLHYSHANVSQWLCIPATHSIKTSKAFAAFACCSGQPREENSHWQPSSFSSLFPLKPHSTTWSIRHVATEGNLKKNKVSWIFLSLATVTKYTMCYILGQVRCSKQAVVGCLRGVLDYIPMTDS